MTIRRLSLIIVSIAVLLIACWIFVSDWYYERYTWPADIQERVLGRVIVSKARLIEYADYTHFGQGTHIWRYQIDETDPETIALCGGLSVHKCSITRWKQIEANVIVYVELADGILTLTEAWS